MRKTSLLLTIAASGSLFLASCGSSNQPAAEGETTAPATETTVSEKTVTKQVDLAASSVKWVGKMIGIKAHDGVISLQEGELTLAGDKVVGGKFVVDMSSITPLDNNYTAPGSAKGTKEHLIGHLASDDFFAIEQHPTASFEITGANEDGSVNGNLTIRGNTNAETVTNVVVGDEVVSGSLTFDRKKYNVSWDSPMQDAILSNGIELEIELKLGS